MKASILVVDDEVAICDMLRLALETAGFSVSVAYNGKRAWQIINEQMPDLLVLDWMMPEMTGIELTRRIKQDPDLQSLPIIMLTARGEEDSKITGLESGADDYVTKPFSTRELVSRIRALLRRLAPSTLEQQLQHGELVLDVLSMRARGHGQEIALGPIEFKLLEFLMRQPERVFSREQLLNRVWGGDVYIEERTVDVHIMRLRKALKASDLDDLIETVRGSGYRLRAV